MELIDKFCKLVKYLPDEIINIIINYTGVIVYRHGKYINRLKKTDDRYFMIKKIPRPIFIGKYKILLRLIDYNMAGYFIEYNTEDLIKVNIRFFYREIDGFDKYYDIKSNNTYIFDINNRWCKIVQYFV